MGKEDITVMNELLEPMIIGADHPPETGSKHLPKFQLSLYTIVITHILKE